MKFNKEAKPLIPYLITFTMSLYFFLELCDTVKLFTFIKFVPAVFSLFSIFGLVVISLLLLLSILGILNYLGVTNAQLTIGKAGIKTFNEWLFFIFICLYFFIFLFQEIYYGVYIKMFDWQLLFNLLFLVVVYFGYIMYVSKVENEKTIISFEKKAKVDKPVKLAKTETTETETTETENLKEEEVTPKKDKKEKKKTEESYILETFQVEDNETKSDENQAEEVLPLENPIEIKAETKPNNRKK